MRPSRVRLPGLRPTLRHWMILVVYFALLSAALAPLVPRAAPDRLSNAALAAVLLSPWALTVLVLALDRPGPIKYWAAPLLFVSSAPMLALCYDCVVLRNYLVLQVKPNLAVSVVVNVFFIGSFVVYLTLMGPLPCPGCERRALIPWLTLWGRTRRLSSTRWCACCGGTYWRHPGGTWKPERRMTCPAEGQSPPRQGGQVVAEGAGHLL